MSEHADIEALSAFVDGEAPEWADHVAACPACAASAEALRAVADAVGAPVEPDDAGMRELAIGAALAPAPAATVTPLPLRRRRPSIPARWMIPAVAAMVLVVAGISAVLTVADRSSTQVNATAAGPAADSKSNESLAQAPAAGSLGVAAPTADLGDVADAATLLARARPGLAARGSASAATSSGGATSSGAASPGGATAAPASPNAAVPSPAIVGTRPCEEQARARQPSLGAVVYFATARRNGAPAVVLGFSTGPDPSQVTLLMLAQDGCAEILRAAAP